MTDYTQAIDFGDKDALATGNPLKRIKGTEVDSELTAIALAIASKYDSGDLASQVQAEAGALNTVLMTPLRSFQSQAAYLLTGRVVPDGALSTNVPLLNVANVFTAGQAASTASPFFRLDASGATTNQRSTLVRLGTTGGFALSSATDAASTTSVNDLILAARSGTTWSSLALAATTITLNGVSTADYARLSQNNVFTGTSQRISGSTAALAFGASGSTTSRRNFDIASFSDALFIRLLSDDFSSSLGTIYSYAVASGLHALGGTALNTAACVLTTDNSSASEPGFKGAPSRNVASSTNTAATDAGGTIRFTGGSGQTFTLDSDPPTDSIVVLRNTSGNNWTIAASGTLTLAGGSTGSRTLATNGMASAQHDGSGNWCISGAGLS